MTHYTTMKAKDLPEAVTDEELKHWQIENCNRPGQWSDPGRFFSRAEPLGRSLIASSLTLRTAKQVPGQWYRNTQEVDNHPVLYCVGYAPRGEPVLIDRGDDSWLVGDAGEHLPACTGFDWEPEPEPKVIFDGPGAYEAIDETAPDRVCAPVVLDGDRKDLYGVQWDKYGKRDGFFTLTRKIDALPETIPDGYRLTSPPLFEEPNGRPCLSWSHHSVMKLGGYIDDGFNEGRRWIVEPDEPAGISDAQRLLQQAIDVLAKIGGRG